MIVQMDNLETNSTGERYSKTKAWDYKRGYHVLPHEDEASAIHDPPETRGTWLIISMAMSIRQRSVWPIMWQYHKDIWVTLPRSPWPGNIKNKVHLIYEMSTNHINMFIDIWPRIKRYHRLSIPTNTLLLPHFMFIHINICVCVCVICFKIFDWLYHRREIMSKTQTFLHAGLGSTLVFKTYNIGLQHRCCFWER